MTIRTWPIAVVLIFGMAGAAAQPAPAPTKLVVGTHEIAPFVIKNADGSWSGISIDLWKQVAEATGLAYEIRELPIDVLVSGHPSADVVVSLNITEKNEESYDLTHAFFHTGLGIATRKAGGDSVWSTLAKLATARALLALTGLIALLLGAGVLMWLIERRQNPDEFGGRDGWLQGLFWSVEAVIGYGDPTHKTRGGRVLGILWAFFGILLVAGVTAHLASSMTLDRLEGKVGGPDDLPKVRVGAVKPSSGFRYLERRGIVPAHVYPDVEQALAGLAAGELDAVVFEAPILRYQQRRAFADRVVVLPGTFDNHGYGFGLTAGSPHRELIDRAVLRISGSDAFRGLLTTYLGDDG